MIFLVSVLGFLSLGAQASNQPLEANTTASFTVTTTSSYQVTTSGLLQVNFNSIQLTNPPPQAYGFGVYAKTFPGNWITRIIWHFGDGEVLDVPYCCQSSISEVQYHSYAKPGQYTVTVVAFDNIGNFGDAEVTVDWITPIPEYSAYAVPLAATILVALFGTVAIRKRSK
jgi:PKD repeat protein